MYCSVLNISIAQIFKNALQNQHKVYYYEQKCFLFNTVQDSKNEQRPKVAKGALFSCNQPKFFILQLYLHHFHLELKLKIKNLRILKIDYFQKKYHYCNFDSFTTHKYYCTQHEFLTKIKLTANGLEIIYAFSAQFIGMNNTFLVHFHK